MPCAIETAPAARIVSERPFVQPSSLPSGVPFAAQHVARRAFGPT
jgi:hypothetical protein